MPQMSEKEKCFQKAWDNYKDATGDKMDIESQKPWGLDKTSGQWKSDYSSVWHALNSFWSYLRGGSGSTQQLRFPDLTVSQGGSTSVVDLKFTRADGSVDKWGTKPGAGSRKLQQSDYNSINEQMNGKDPYGGDASLSAKSCKCDEPGGTATAPVTVLKEVPSTDGLYFMPQPAPGGLLSPGAVPGGVTVPGGGGMLPEFVFP